MIDKDKDQARVLRVALDKVDELRDENEKLRDRVKHLSPWANFGMAMLVESRDAPLSYEYIEDAAIETKVLIHAPYGYDPSEHESQLKCIPKWEELGVEPGDPWLIAIDYVDWALEKEEDDAD